MRAYENSIPTIIWQPKPFWSPSNSVTTNGWRPGKEEFDKPLSIYFGPLQGWVIFKSMVPSQPSQFFRWQLKFFSYQKRGACHMLFENLLTSLDKKIPKNKATPLLWELKQFGRHPKNSDNRLAIQIF
jgi:hypothetical protein